MKIRAFVTLCVLAAFAAAAPAESKKGPAPAGSKNARFEQFKQLTGEWVGTASGCGVDEKDVHVLFKVTGGRRAVVQTDYPGAGHEMVTVIAQDGGDLALTHYCCLGNQPRMKAEGKGSADKIVFQFAGIGNANPNTDTFIHDMTYTFVDKDTLKVEYSHCRECKVDGKIVFELKRKK